MKKWLGIIVVLLILLVVIVVSFYVFIPSKIVIGRVDKITANETGLTRNLSDKKNWKKWWPGKVLNDSVYELNNNNYIVAATANNAYFFKVKTKNANIDAKLLLFDLGNNATMLAWQYDTVLVKGNIISKPLNYFSLNALKKDLKQINYALSIYASDTQKVYGIKIQRQSIDQLLYISTKKNYTYLPHSNEVNDIVNELRKYITANNVTEAGSPIFHITAQGNNSYELMVAIGVSKVMAGDATYHFKRMVPGSFLVSRAVGDETKIDFTNKQLQYFFDDNHNTSMAIDFCMMITDRQKEKDSTKWITDIYKPVY